MRRIVVPLAIALLAAACSSDASPPGSTATIPTDDGTVAQTTTIPSGTTEATVATEVTAAPTTTITLPQSRNAGRRGSSQFPSLDDPPMIAIDQATWIEPDDVVLGIVAPNGDAHAFPVNQMTFHHIANTTVAGEPYLVTY